MLRTLGQMIFIDLLIFLILRVKKLLDLNSCQIFLDVYFHILLLKTLYVMKILFLIQCLLI